jgi:hypothetical protein
MSALGMHIGVFVLADWLVNRNLFFVVQGGKKKNTVTRDTCHLHTRCFSCKAPGDFTASPQHGGLLVLFS